MLRKQLFDHCLFNLKEKLNAFEAQKKRLAKALTTEEKNSAGDKHETGRAMIQLEREKLGVQLAETEQNFRSLLRLQEYPVTNTIALGTVVITDKANYYLSVPTVACIVDLKTYHCISVKSPIGKLLLGKKIKDSFTFNNISHTILAIH